jgi:hypothetical protein
MIYEQRLKVHISKQVYESPEDGHRSGPKHVVEVIIHIKPQILLRTEVYKKVFDRCKELYEKTPWMHPDGESTGLDCRTL